MIYRTSTFIIFLGLFLSFSSLRAQNLIAPKDVLLRAQEHPAIELLRNNIQGLENTDRSLPFVEELEFRTESDEMNLGRQEYLFRMRFNKRESRRVQERINQNTLQHYELRATLLAERQQADHYEYLAEWYYLDQELAYLAQQKILFEDQLQLYRTIASNASQLDITNLLKTEEDLQELERDQLQLELQRGFLIQYFVPEADPSTIQLEGNGWITLETMHSRVERIMRDTQETTKLKMQQAEIDVAQLEYELEVAESRRFLEFVQAKYAGRNNLDLEQEFSLGIGFLIPTKSTNRVDINEARLDKFDEEFQLKMMALELEEDIRDAFQKFDRVWQSYQLLQQQIADKQYAVTLERYKKNAGVSPLTLLQLQALIQKQQRDLMRLEEAACFQYLDLLALTGLLHPDRTINYLSEDWQSFR